MSFSAGGHDTLRADYILNFQTPGYDEAQRADRTIRAATKTTADVVKQTSATVDAAARRQADAWKMAARTAERANKQVFEAHSSATAEVDRSTRKMVASLRRQGEGYDQIIHKLREQGRAATESAAAVERSAQREVAAIDRVDRARNKIRQSVGLSSTERARSHGYAREERGFGRGALGGISSKLRYGASALGGGLIGGIAGYVGVSAIKDAAQQTTELAKQSAVFSKFTGMNRQTALEYGAITQAYGVSSKSLGQTFRALGSTMNTALAKPTAANTQAFRQLGITQAETKAHAHDLSGMLGLVADRLQKMPAGAAKTADAAKLLGRNWTALAPVLADGSKGLNQNLAAAKALGVQMGGHSAEQMAKLHEATIQLKLAQIGLEIQFTQHILPALLKLVSFGLKVYEVVRKNLSPAFHFFGVAVHAVSGFLKEHTTLMKAAGIAVTAFVTAMVGLKIISTVVRMGRGLVQSGRETVAMFRALRSPVASIRGAFTEQASAAQKAAEQNKVLTDTGKPLLEQTEMQTKANQGLAASYEEVAAAARAAAEAEAMSGRAGAVGGAENALGGVGRGATAAEGEAAAASRAAMGGEAALATEGAGAATLAEGAGAAGAAGGILGKAKGLLGGVGGRLMGGLGIAGMGLMGAQLGGSLIGGITGNKKVGSAISAIGSGAAIGAGIGSVIPGVGTLIGGGVGAGVGALSHFVGLGNISNAIFGGPSQGQVRANSLVAGMAKHAATADRATLAKWQQEYTRSLGRGYLGTSRANEIQRTLTQRGLALAAPALQSTMGQIATSRYRPGAGAIASRTEADLAHLPGQAQRIGSEAMIKFTAGLESKGQLPRGSTDRLIRDLQDKYGPKLQQRLQVDGNASMAVIAATIRNSKVVSAAQNQTAKIEQTWGVMVPKVEVTAQNFSTSVGSQMTALEKIVETSHGRMRDNAIADWKKLHDVSIQHFSDMADKVTAQQNALSGAIASGSNQALSAATSNFQALQNNIQSAVGAGVITAQQGSRDIAKAVNATLKAFKARPIPVNVELQHLARQHVIPQTGVQNVPGVGLAFHAATGARVPGAPGPDNWMLLGPGGQAAALVAGGELLVTNRHTEARVDQMLAPYGTSLGREVAGETRPQYATTGARVASGLPRFATGGAMSFSAIENDWITAGGPRSVAPTAAAITGAEAGFNPRAIQPGQPYRTRGWGLWQITPGNSEPQFGVDAALLNPMNNARAAVAKYRGSGNTFRPWTTYNDGAYRAFLGGRGAGSGTGGSAALLTPPHVRGSGSMAEIDQHALDILTGAANSFIQSQTGGGGSVSLLGGRHRAEPLSGGPVLRRMIAEANAIASHNYNYEWGGGHGRIGVPNHGTGHGSGPGVGFDCSGTVSAVLHAGGLLNSPLTAAGFMSWGDRGRGRAVSIFASPSHVFMEMGGHYFGTSGGNPGGGANWIPSFPENMPAVRHPPGMARGGRVLSNGRGWDLDWDQMPQEERSRHARNPLAILPGKASGGLVRAATGTTNLGGWTVPTTGTHPKGRKPPAVHMHLDPFTGRYEPMTGAQASKLRDQYIQKFGHPYRAPTSSRHRTTARGRRPPAAHMHFNPFTGRFQLMTSDEARRLRDRYIQRFGRTPPTGPPRPSTTTSRTTRTVAGMTVAQALAGGFDVGYQYGVDPTQGGVVSPFAALNATLRGMGQAGSGGVSYVPLYRSRGGYVSAARRGHHPSGYHHSGHHVAVASLVHAGLYSPYADWSVDPSIAYDANYAEDASRAAMTTPYGYGSALGGLSGLDLRDVAAAEIESAGAPQAYVGSQIVGTRNRRRATRSLARSLQTITRGGDKAKVDRATKLLGKDLNEVANVSYNHLTELSKTIEREQKRHGTSTAAKKRLAQALQLIQYQEGRRTGALVAQAEGQANALQTASTRLGRLMQRRNVDGASAQGARMLADFDAHAQQVLTGTVAQLRTALKNAQRAKDTSAIKDITDKLTQALDQLDQATTDAVVAQRDAIEAAAQAATDTATRGTTSAQSRESALGILQNLAAAGASPATIAAAESAAGLSGIGAVSSSGSLAGGQQMADYINASILPALKLQLSAQQTQLTTARAQGDSALANQIADAIAQTQNDILQGTLDAVQATAANTQAMAASLATFNTSTGFAYQNQEFTDLIGVGVGI